jgi:hypothetical protein
LGFWMGKRLLCAQLSEPVLGKVKPLELGGPRGGIPYLFLFSPKETQVHSGLQSPGTGIPSLLYKLATERLLFPGTQAHKRSRQG